MTKESHPAPGLRVGQRHVTFLGINGDDLTATDAEFVADILALASGHARWRVRS